MRRLAAFLLAAIVPIVLSCDGRIEDAASLDLCSDAWYRSIEDQVPTGDDRDHGPDVGSDEWKSVVEFKLKVRDKPGIPDRKSEDWCRYIDELMRTG